MALLIELKTSALNQIRASREEEDIEGFSSLRHHRTTAKDSEDLWDGQGL